MILKPNQINDIQTLTDTICEIKAKSQISGYANFFRGTHKPLIPSLGEVSCPLDCIKKLEENLLNLFLKRGGLSEKINLLNRVIAREHNLKSSLMDWSNEIYVPLDFATKAYLKPYFKTTTLYILTLPISEIQTITELNRSMDPGFLLMFNFAVPGFNITTWQKRKFTQGGYFLYQPYNFIQEDLSYHLPETWQLDKIILGKELCKKIRKSLLNNSFDLRKSSMPVSSSSFKNSDRLDGICKRLNKKTQIEK